MHPSPQMCWYLLLRHLSSWGCDCLFQAFVLPLSVCLFVSSLYTHTLISLQYLVFSLWERLTAVNSKRFARGQVLSGLGGMCWGVPLLVVTKFRTLLGKLFPPESRRNTAAGANYKNKTAWFIKDLLSHPLPWHTCMLWVHVHSFVLPFFSGDGSCYSFLPEV